MKVERKKKKKKNEEEGKEDTDHLLVSYDEISHSGWFSFLFFMQSGLFFQYIHVLRRR